MQSIQWQVINYWQQRSRLPNTLDDLADPIASYAVPKDPEFEEGRVYEYTRYEAMSFEICATFTLPMPKGWVENRGYGVGGAMPMRDVAVSSMPYPGGAGENWDHDAGRSCYQRTIDPEVYPPFPKPLR